ncbi:hypothetical protein N7532_008216 [Penicillium argentinense]|uniref:PH domain-containing protein n=1 Tax=Penicillium argentinense TaxID=1131581 RepID=A0A9W9EWZ4_9EURO|nr:uncharacterized protein N7532_008216 [Penicillium argentinense]KAJ5089532.1 hypothetical protein N7532_008216 [Penicillium argentinense]
MSDVQKPVEETPAAVPAETPAEAATTEAPKETTEDAPAAATEEAAAADKPAETAETTEPAKEEAKEEVKPATEGYLGYKRSGTLKGFRFTKNFFYFNEEATEAKNLSVFQQNEKAAANPTVAWATQTGKGLLFVTKRVEDKGSPADIFNLAEVSDITKEGTKEFLFKVGGQKRTFQASSAAERDSWVVALEAKAAEAKAEKETITSSEGYKAELEKLTKPAATAATSNSDKSESVGKRNSSLFGRLGKGKEAAAETKPAEPAAEPAAEEIKPAEPVAEETKPAEPAAEDTKPAEETKPAEPATESAAATATETAETAEVPADAAEKKEEKKEDKEKKSSKRASLLFGSFFNKVSSPSSPSQEKSQKEATAPVEENAVASTAPQLDNPVDESAVEPIKPESVTAAADSEDGKKAAAEAPAEPKDTTKAANRRASGIFGVFGSKKDKETSDNEATDGEKEAKKTDGDNEAKKSNPLGKLWRKSTHKGPNPNKKAVPAETEVKADKPEEATQEATQETSTEPTAKETAAESDKPAQPAAEEAKNVNVPASTPVQAAA